MAKPLKTSAPVRANHEIRIIGGAWRRTRIAVRDLPGLRPTPDRVRETLFNWLGQDLNGWRCLDVFAGTGVLGLEAASRGAADVVLVEQDRTLVEAIAATLLRLLHTWTMLTAILVDALTRDVSCLYKCVLSLGLGLQVLQPSRERCRPMKWWELGGPGGPNGGRRGPIGIWIRHTMCLQP